MDLTLGEVRRRNWIRAREPLGSSDPAWRSISRSSQDLLWTDGLGEPPMAGDLAELVQLYARAVSKAICWTGEQGALDEAEHEHGHKDEHST